MADKKFEEVLKQIESKAKDTSWERRLEVINMIADAFSHLPDQETAEKLFGILSNLSKDEKWEVRKAAIPVLLNSGNKKAKDIILTLTYDNNRWVRQAAQFAQRRFRRLTSPGRKIDKRIDLAFDLVKQLDSMSLAQRYEAILRMGEEYYEELAEDTVHGLNSGLTTLQAYSKQLFQEFSKRDLSDKKLKDLFHRFEESQSFFSRLVKSLVEYSKHVEAEYIVENLYYLLCEAVGLAKARVQHTNPGLELKEEVFEVDKQWQIGCHRDRLLTAFVNIICNALESMDKKGTLTIRTEVANKETVRIIIADTGCGMNPSQIENAVRRFRTNKQEKGGIGLGLPIAKRIIEEEHNGLLEIKSQKGKGTTVIIEIPILQGPWKN